MKEPDGLTPDRARDRIRRIQNGSGLDRDRFPDDFKGEIARHAWMESMFSYGMEYGYLLAMIDVIEETDSTVPSEEDR